MEDKIKTLATFLGIDPEDVSETTYDTFEVSSKEYRVLDDNEREEAWNESLESYIDECILPQVEDETFSMYFDRDAWKRDARFDGAGICLAPYDHVEEYLEPYWIYRTN